MRCTPLQQWCHLCRTCFSYKFQLRGPMMIWKEPKLISLLGSAPPPQKKKEQQSTKKLMATVFCYAKCVLLVDFILHSQTFKWTDWEKLFYWKICVRLSSICMTMPLPNVAAWQVAPVILESFSHFQLFGTVNIWEMILYITLLVQTLAMGCHLLWSEYLCSILAPILIVTILEWNIIA